MNPSNMATVEAPRTFHDWCVLLGTYDLDGSGIAERFLHDPRQWEALAGSAVDVACGAQTMAMIARFVERAMCMLNDGLIMDLEDYGADADSMALVLARYGEDCRRLLFFESVGGLPQADVHMLCGQIVQHVRGNLRQLAASQGMDEDIAYTLHVELRHWEG